MRPHPITRWPAKGWRLLTVLPALLVAAAAVLGPSLAPHPAEQPVGIPFADPGADAWLGTDRLGRDVLSRVLYGGWGLLLLAVVIAVLVTVVSAVLGAVAALRSRIGVLIETATDLAMLVPAVLGILLVLTSWPNAGTYGLIVIALLFGAPYCARVFGAAAAGVARSGYVESATASGERLPHLVFREVLPNLREVFAGQLGLRFVAGIYLVSTASFLQLPTTLGATNWAVMVRENASGMLLNPWSVLAPGLAIAIVAVSVNLAADGFGRADPGLPGRSADGENLGVAEIGSGVEFSDMEPVAAVSGGGSVHGAPDLPGRNAVGENVRTAETDSGVECSGVVPVAAVGAGGSVHAVPGSPGGSAHGENLGVAEAGSGVEFSDIDPVAAVSGGGSVHGVPNLPGRNAVGEDLGVAETDSGVECSGVVPVAAVGAGCSVHAVAGPPDGSAGGEKLGVAEARSGVEFSDTEPVAAVSGSVHGVPRLPGRSTGGENLGAAEIDSSVEFSGVVAVDGGGSVHGVPDLRGGSAATGDLWAPEARESSAEPSPIPAADDGCAADGSRAAVVVEGLVVRGRNGQELLGPVSFRMQPGLVTALTGPSGSGKTTLMRALLGHVPSGAVRSAGMVSVAGQDVFGLDPVALHKFRRDRIAYVGQDPGSALNPLMRVRGLLAEVARDPSDALLLETLELVGLGAEHLRRHPGELSGGQQRRVALARALVRRTGILVLDEPLAGLHGTLRTDIARLLADIAAQRGTAILLSGHDTAAVHAIADTIVELGTVRSVTDSAAVGDRSGGRRSRLAAPESVATAVADRPVPRHSGLAASVLADIGEDTADLLPGRIAPETADSAARRGAIMVRAKAIDASIGGKPVLNGIDLAIPAGSALAVVGASGAGKTTLARVIAGLHREATGALELRGATVAIGPGRRIRHGGNGIQLVTQNPRSALNPRRTVAQTLGRPLHRIGGMPKYELRRGVTELLASVELAAEFAGRYPHQLSGGQRQRVALARALAAEPAVLVCDEITSALDHATAASIMVLLDRIRAQRGTALLVISHDIPLVAAHCPHLVVLDHGRIVESGDTEAVLAAPAHTATRDLLG
ncbi:ATP-binding cassette domain-containing protein [Nocardia sp. NPDC050710]|uniref:ABC transporter ATP-binding protein/permease n=1 Tax=Nocardia sp. NPDC050710 TaxID=3157220 RepID=UPI00340FAE92